MKLVIHAGLHKTATTSFQRFCHENREVLAGHAVHYPDFGAGDFHHNALAHAYQMHNLAQVEGFLRKSIDTASADTGVVLLSGEDLELVLGHSAMAQEIDEIAKKVGFDRLEWCFVVRDRWSYLLSLYSELSKHGVLANFADMVEQVLRFRSFACESPNARWYHEFDYEGRLVTAEKGLGTSVQVLDFADFCSGGVGRKLLGQIAGKSLQEALEPMWVNRVANNARDSWISTEYRFACRFLGIDPRKWRWLKALAVLPIIIFRECIKRRSLARLEPQFRSEFPDFRPPSSSHMAREQ